MERRFLGSHPCVKSSCSICVMDGNKVRYLVLGIFAGFIAGLLVFDKTAENQRLRAERDQARAQLTELGASRPRVKSYVGQGQGPTLPRNSAGALTVTRDAAAFPFEITDEERTLREALRLRRNNGEYLNEFEDP